jgi:hypothetical protein
MFPSSGEEREREREREKGTPTLLGPLERANLSYTNSPSPHLKTETDPNA